MKLVALLSEAFVCLGTAGQGKHLWDSGTSLGTDVVPGARLNETQVLCCLIFFARVKVSTYA